MITIGSPVSLTTRIERRFYAVVRWFGLLLASLTFLATLGAGFNSLHKLTSAADDSIHPPTVSYENSRRSIESSRAVSAKSATDNTLEQKEQEEARAKEDADYERKLKPHLDTILANLTKYAAKVQLAKPSEQGVDDFARNNMKAIRISIDDTMAWNYIDGLEKATSDLAADGDRIAKLPTEDPQRLRWDEFLAFYTHAFRMQVTAELARIEKEHLKASADKIEAWGIMYVAGALFLVFVVATILLVLLRIERNTRPI